MDKNKKKHALTQLGVLFDNCLKNERLAHQELSNKVEEGVNLIDSVVQSNAWFTPESVRLSFEAWSNSLQEDKVDKWLDLYDFVDAQQKVGVIMAGNLPLVGLHDALCVLISGNILHAKLSSKDQLLMKWVLESIVLIVPEWKSAIQITDNLKEIDVLIATGSDNSSRYFDYYFKDKNRIIRKNRTSVAILNGDETEEELKGLSNDVFTHFGLGCRNVTKVFLPTGFDLDRLFNAFYSYKEIVNHNKYGNNYDYNKAVYLLNQVDLVENGFLLLKEDEGLHSPVGVLFYEFYEKISDVLERLESENEKIQCKVGNVNENGFVAFGKAQQPELWNYADGVDTIKFLST